ncbi:hypothetical protein AVEN_182709-1 [Araneus ventricosus]|uniref:Uncharacterized protein n=1 Tax=Araneus ventricosus TaxID=182803 RepID=A0A4Y2K089_ARAVE|nr:hypothetical protein AVEN_182709-1 [Araneus ventricosus]
MASDSEHARWWVNASRAKFGHYVSRILSLTVQKVVHQKLHLAEIQQSANLLIEKDVVANARKQDGCSSSKQCNELVTVKD